MVKGYINTIELNEIELCPLVKSSLGFLTVLREQHWKSLNY